MKKVLLKDTFKEIKKTYKRFISIILMALLGVGFFVGIKGTSPNMKYRLEQYFNEKNVFELRVVSTLGSTEDDLKIIKSVKGVKDAYGVYDQDAIYEKDNTEYIINVMQYEPGINEVNLLAGRMPKAADECVIEEAFARKLNVVIGDFIKLNLQRDSETKGHYQNSELKVVGIITSPLYISQERGNSNLGSGKVDYYLYLNGSNITADFYTSVYLILENSGMEDAVKDALAKLAPVNTQLRYEKLVDETLAKIEDSEAILSKEKKQAEREIKEAEQKLKTAEQKINAGKKELNAGKKQATKELQKAKTELFANEKKYNDEKVIAQNALKQLNLEKTNLEKQLASIIKEINERESEYASADAATQLVLEGVIKQFNIQKEQVKSGLDLVEKNITKISKQLTDGKAALDAAKKTLTQEEVKTKNKFKKVERDLNTAEVVLIKGQRKLSQSKQDFFKQIGDAELKLADAKTEVTHLKNPKWHILNRREGNAGYAALTQDADSINNISKVFPVMFFVVAALMSLTSMTRMIDEQRTGIGTLKALGYSKLQISSKYLIYAISATVIGSLLGTVLGYKIIPPIILDAYGVLYDLPARLIVYDGALIITGLLVALICIGGGAFYASYRKMRYVPAQLMRPKAPKPGKRVFLERINFIWKRLTFSQKVTIRNIFRYKKRFMMTIIGITGATALILVGFGIKNSVSKVVYMQYEKIYQHQMMLGLKAAKSLENSPINELLTTNAVVKDILKAELQTIKIVKNEDSKDVQLMVFSEPNKVNDFITLRNSKTKKPYLLTGNGVIITERVAKMLNIKTGETITIENDIGETKQVNVIGITEHYVSHYLYMSEGLFEELYGKCDLNTVLVKTSEGAEAAKGTLGKELLKQSDVSYVTIYSGSVETLAKAIEMMDLVVVVLIVSAGILTLVVLYNLSNVNISERTRELATLKVLGFYDNEVNKYISREMLILTSIGIVTGLLAGYFLTIYILHTVELEFLMFPSIIEPVSYLYAVLIVVVFTVLINIIAHFTLKKISMIDSLKSVE